MERHAQQCFGCGKVVDEAQKLGRMARELERVSAPPDFEANLLLRIRRDGLTRRAWRYWFWPGWLSEAPAWRAVAVSAAAVVLLTAATFTATRWFRGDRVPENPISVEKTGEGEVPLHVAEPVQPSVDGAGSAAIESGRQAAIPAGRSRAEYPIESGRSPLFMESADSDYVEYLVPGPGDRQVVMRLPKKVRMRYGQPSEDYFIRNVSH